MSRGSGGTNVGASHITGGLLAVVAAALLLACEEPAPTASGPEETVAAASTQGIAQRISSRPHERQNRELAQRFPDAGYAGFYLTGGRQAHVRVTNLAPGPQVASAVHTLLKERWAGPGGPTAVPTPIIQAAEYTFEELAGWRNDIAAQLFGKEEKGIVSLDVKIRTNRVVVGVLPEADMDAARDRVASLGIPLDAVSLVEDDYTVTGRSSVSLSRSVLHSEDFLTQWWDTIMGGIQIEYVAHDGEDIWCTLGPMVSKGNEVDSERGYLTNSHCSSDPYDTDGDPHWQNLNDFPSYIIGYETLDPQRYAPGGKVVIQYDDGTTREVKCAEHGCRWSDAAYTTFAPSSLRVHGHALVAEPKYMNTTSGAIEVDPNSMGFQVSGELSNPIEGEVVHKVGRVTGWTSDTVMSACKDSVQEDDKTGEKTTLLCQDFAKYSHDIGDSGSPVFVFTMGGNIRIIGMHVGEAKNTGYGMFSAVANIEEDLEMDLHFGPWFY